MAIGSVFVFKINNHNPITISISYRNQELITTEVQRNGESTKEYDHSTNYNGLELKFGFYFDKN